MAGGAQDDEYSKKASNPLFLGFLNNPISKKYLHLLDLFLHVVASIPTAHKLCISNCMFRVRASSYKLDKELRLFRPRVSQPGAFPDDPTIREQSANIPNRPILMVNNNRL